MTPAIRLLLPRFAALLLVALILTACVQIEVESEFSSDGSAVHSVTSTVDRTLIDDEMISDQLDEAVDFDEIEREGEAAGFNVERIDTADRYGIRLSTEVHDNEDLGDVLEQLFQASGGEVPTGGRFEGGFRESGGIGGSAYQFELTVDGSSLLEGELDETTEDAVEDELDGDFDIGMVSQLLNLTYTVAMPGEITEHNGNSLGGGRVQWEIPLGETVTFFAESEEGTTFSPALIIGVGIGVIALILVIVGTITLRRGQKAPLPTSDTERPADRR